MSFCGDFTSMFRPVTWGKRISHEHARTHPHDSGMFARTPPQLFMYLLCFLEEITKWVDDGSPVDVGPNQFRFSESI